MSPISTEDADRRPRGPKDARSALGTTAPIGDYGWSFPVGLELRLNGGTYERRPVPISRCGGRGDADGPSPHGDELATEARLLSVGDDRRLA